MLVGRVATWTNEYQTPNNAQLFLIKTFCAVPQDEPTHLSVREHNGVRWVTWHNSVHCFIQILPGRVTRQINYIGMSKQLEPSLTLHLYHYIPVYDRYWQDPETDFVKSKQYNFSHYVFNFRT